MAAAGALAGVSGAISAGPFQAWPKVKAVYAQPWLAGLVVLLMAGLAQAHQVAECPGITALVQGLDVMDVISLHMDALG